MFSKFCALRSLLAIVGSLVVIPWLSGCATTATLQTLVPADFDVQGIESLAVMEIAGPEEMVPQLRQQSLEALRQSNFYQVVDPGPPPQLADADQQREVMLTAARRLGVDAIFTAEVQRRLKVGTEFGGVRLQFGDSEVHVQLSFRVIDARSGQVRHEQTVTESFVGEFGPPGFENAEAATEQLTADCLQQAIRSIVVTRQPLEVPLTSTIWPWGREHLEQGNRAARKGSWPVARQAWQQAVQTEPASAAALYSLGLACEAEHDYERARHWYTQARQHSDSKIYQEALQRVQLTEAGYQLATAQSTRPRGARQNPSISANPRPSEAGRLR